MERVWLDSDGWLSKIDWKLHSKFVEGLGWYRGVAHVPATQAEYAAWLSHLARLRAAGWTESRGTLYPPPGIRKGPIKI